MRTFPSCLAATLAGAATLFAFAPWRLFWLMPLSLAALAWIVEKNRDRAFACGYLWGAAAYLGNFHWVYNSLHDIADMPSWLALPLTALLPGYLALYPALAVRVAARLGHTPLTRWSLVFPASWLLGEWLRGVLFTGFPWGQIAYSQITESPLAGFAPVTGIYGVSLLLALLSGLLATLALTDWRWRTGRPVPPDWRRRIALAGGIAAIALAGSALKSISWTEPVGKPLTVALAQGNIPQSIKWDPVSYQSTLELYYRQVAETRADLMILPETALPVFLEQLPPGYLSMLAGDAQRHGMAVALGVVRQSPDGQHYYNAVVAPTEVGLPGYAKDHLVPFGEFIPLPALTGWIYRFMNMPMSGFSRGGADQPPLTLAGQQVAFNICYEDSFGEELIGPAAHATLLANVSNLAWFGKSSAASLHLQMSQTRALETGRYMLRATNTGMTGIILPNGEVSEVAAPFSRQVLEGQVEGRRGLTPYMRSGNAPTLIVALLMLLLAWRLPRSARVPAYSRKRDTSSRN
ncbi:apolipoprotein N-acyltransferase [Paludibacterium yongneupense]|uniref:apolipoprotein N-acyltransferase n=1 Tax=Paludibacterium yongneupense TaxID=400061 RepID=UPI0003FFD2FD|nr:apolipoprotein N-acyltransferase [Paludibacterium yongneupense]